MAAGKEATFTEHLEALRATLIKSLSILAIGLVPIYFITPYVLETLIKIILGKNTVTLNFFTPLEVFILQLKMALLLDILVCFPYISKQVWKFVLPGLYDNERKLIKSVVAVSSALFIAGVLFCMFFILPALINFGLGFATDEIRPVLGIDNILTLVIRISFIFGLMFQFPLITYALLHFNIVNYENVKSKRAYVFVIILIISGILTPPDIISQLFLTIPTYALFEIGLFFGKKCGNLNNYSDLNTTNREGKNHV